MQVLSEGQEVTFEYQGTNYLLRVNSIMVVDEHAEQQSVSRGKLIPETAFVYETRAGSGLKITGQRRCGATYSRCLHDGCQSMREACKV